MVTMKPCIHVVTLAVADLDRALAFYRDGLGFPTEGLIGTEYTGTGTSPDGTTAVFHLDGGLMLSIYPRSELAKDAAVASGNANPGEFSIGQVVASRAEVDEVIAQARSHHPPRPARPALGHLLRLLPGSRRPPLGDHLEPGPRPHLVLRPGPAVGEVRRDVGMAGLNDPPAGAPAPVGVVAHGQAELGGQDDLVPAAQQKSRTACNRCGMAAH